MKLSSFRSTFTIHLSLSLLCDNYDVFFTLQIVLQHLYVTEIEFCVIQDLCVSFHPFLLSLLRTIYIFLSLPLSSLYPFILLLTRSEK